MLRILDKAPLGSLSTTTAPSRPHINTAFFVLDQPTLAMYFLSEPGTQHIRNIAATPQGAATFFDSHQIWGDALSGVQLFGSVSESTGADRTKADALYRARFPAFG